MQISPTEKLRYKTVLTLPIRSLHQAAHKYNLEFVIPFYDDQGNKWFYNKNQVYRIPQGDKKIEFMTLEQPKILEVVRPVVIKRKRLTKWQAFLKLFSLS